MNAFGIGSALVTITPFAGLFLTAILATLILSLGFGFASWKIKKMNSTNAKVASGSMRELQADENRFFIRPAMKPHYHGNLKIGYVERMKFGVHVFSASGQIKGITGSDANARSYLRGIHKVTDEHQMGKNGSSREDYRNAVDSDLGDSSRDRPSHRH